MRKWSEKGQEGRGKDMARPQMVQSVRSACSRQYLRELLRCRNGLRAHLFEEEVHRALVEGQRNSPVSNVPRGIREGAMRVDRLYRREVAGAKGQAYPENAGYRKEHTRNKGADLNSLQSGVSSDGKDGRSYLRNLELSKWQN